MENDKEYWDQRSVAFKKIKDEDVYLDAFLDFLELKENDSIFDMGCGSGIVALPLALKDHKVIAADFSDNMLHLLMEDAKKMHCEGKITPILLDWDEDWSFRALDKCDIAIASRSFPLHDTEVYIKKLESAAKKEVLISEWPKKEREYEFTADLRIISELKRMGRKPITKQLDFATGKMSDQGIHYISLIKWYLEDGNEE